MKSYKPGETFERTNKFGVTYLMLKSEKGRSKAIKRLTPYKNKATANSLSNIPESKRTINKTGKLPDAQKGRVGKPFLLNTNKDIKVTPFNPKTHKMAKTDGRTWKMVRI